MAPPKKISGALLAIKNVILNVSGAIFHRQTLLDVLDEVGEDLYIYNVAEDWRLYAKICAQPCNRVSIIPDALSIHRRHREIVTHALSLDKHLAEITEIHRLAASKPQLTPDIFKLQAEYYGECERHLRISS